MATGVPILRLGDYLVASVQEELDDDAALAFADELAQRISAEKAQGLLLDISGLQLVDSFLARLLVEITSMGRLLGARVVVAGMRPPVAITLVELGLPLPGVETALTVEQAMDLLARPPGADDRRPSGPGPGDEGR